MFNFAGPGDLSKFGISPDVLLNVKNEQVVRERREIRRKLISRGDTRSLMDECANAMARPASETVRNLAKTHWFNPISRILDVTSTFGGNILPRVDIEDYLYAIDLNGGSKK